MGDQTMTTVAGFDADRVEAWLTINCDLRGPLRWERLAGGHSNLTYLLRDAEDREVVIRRPPQGPLLPKAHDMWREYRILSALWPTDVPVPEPIGYCDDPAVADAHFYVMSRCAGQPFYAQRDVVVWLGQGDRRRAAGRFVAVLAALHAIEPASVGLGDFGRPDGYLARQLQTWHRSWEAQSEKANHDDARVHLLHDLLSDRMPEEGPARIVHGDYGPHNALFQPNGEVSAILDWEIATLGDPLADFAYAMNAWVGPEDHMVDVPDPPTALPGFPNRGDLVEEYRRLTGADLSRFSYYRAFNYWRRACILQGVYARYRSGQKASEDVDVPAMLVRMNRYLEAALDLVGEVA
jgi:aminoglycoside phosphotransferase (APT) family kinase protein